MRPLIRTVAVAVLAAIFVACGGGSSGGGSDKAQMEKTVRTMIDAFNDGRGDRMYDQLSKRCQTSTTKKEFSANITAAKALLPGVKLELSKFEVAAQNGNEATVRTTLGIKNAPAFLKEAKPEPQESKMVKEGGSWKSDDCEGIGGIG